MPLPQVIPPRRSREQSEKAMKRLKIGRPECDKEQPLEGFPPLKKVEHLESEWNEDVWPLSGWPQDKLIAKGKAEEEYLVKGADLDDLVFIKQHQWYHESKKYRIVEIQRRAWEKYGGPTGLEAAKADRARKRANRKAKRATKPNATPARGGRGGAHTSPRGRKIGRGRAATPIPEWAPVPDSPGPMAISPSPIYAAESLFWGSPSSTRSMSPTDEPPPPGVVSGLDNLAGSSVASPPRGGKRGRESGPMPSTPVKSKRRKVSRMAEDSDALHTSAPGFHPAGYESTLKFPGVIEIDTDDDDFGLGYQLSTVKKRTRKTKKRSASVPKDEVIEISD